MEKRIKLKNNLLKEFNKLPVHSLTANKKEISIRCPYCGDSKKNSRSSHLYVNIDTDSDKFLTYYCQRCKSKGYIHSNFLKNLNLYRQDIVIDIDKVSKEQSKKNKIKGKNYLRKTKLKIPLAEDNKINRIKLKYINSRLGTNLSYKDLVRYKIVLNLYDLLDLNRINFVSCKERMADTLDSNFIGFVSYDNNYIIMRNLSKKVIPDVRYHNYNIFNNYDNTKKFYVLPSKVDIMNESITLVITEGVFDLLSVYFNIEKDKENKIFVAVGGLGYNNVIHEIIRLGFLDINLKIYADSDQNTLIYKSLRNEFNPFINKIELYNNTLYKDFGDVKKGINIRKIMI